MFKNHRDIAIALVLVFLTLSLGFMACREDHIFHEIKEVDQEGWLHEEPVLFNTNISDTSALYDVSVILDHLKTYPFENLYLRITQEAGQESQTDTLTFDIMNREGYYKGSCDGESCRMEARVYDQIRYLQPGPLTFTLEQFTRKDTLKGINALGLVIRKSPKTPD
jgi:gliding motility-associated lipoprotein GldH